MAEQKGYFERLMEEEKYINELDKMYNELYSIRRFKRKLEDVEKEVTWFIGTEANRFVPNYQGFYVHAFEHYIPKQDFTLVKARYKELLGDFDVNAIPGYLYCMVLLGHLVKKENDFIQTNENPEELPPTELEEFKVLHDKCKLLMSLLNKLEPIVAIFINSIDTSSVEHLDDDIKSLDSRAIKHRFTEALRQRDKSMAFKLLGRLQELDEGEDYYFEAISHFINEEYDEAIRYADKLHKTDIDYTSAVALKLECYSIEGDMDGFVACLKANRKLRFDFWHISYLLMELILHLDIHVFDIESLDFDSLFQINFADDLLLSHYYGMTHCLIANIVAEGLEILEAAMEYSQLVDDFTLPEEKSLRLGFLQIALEMHPECSEIKKFLDPDYLQDKDFSEIKREASEHLLILLLNHDPEKDFATLKAALMTQFRLGQVTHFVENTCSLLERLKSYRINDETAVDELLGLAYVEGMLSGTIKENLKSYIESNHHFDLDNDLSQRKIRKFLSAQGNIAYESAEWQFQKSKEIDYGWKDAGMLSLGFYRIMEVELNQKVIIPLLSGIGFTALNNAFTACAATLSGEAKKAYKSKWSKLLKTYEEMENSDFQSGSFMLGMLDYFFKAIGSEYDPTDSLATLIRGNLSAILTSYGETKFDEGFFEEITNDTSRNKYRNPPAHTKYLPYTLACECREFFNKVILQMTDIFKVQQ